MKLSKLLPLLALSCASSSIVCAEFEDAPIFPDTGLLNFTATVVEERLEDFTVNRLKLEGPATIKGDLIPGLIFKQGSQKGPLVFSARNYPDTHASLYAFSNDEFAPKINPETLNSYLARKQVEAPEESRFEIVEAAEHNSGPAKFRFLGGKAFTLTYDYDKIDHLQQHKRFRCTENWRLHKGTFYVFFVEAPVAGLQKHYRLVAGTVNSMHFAE